MNSDGAVSDGELLHKLAALFPLHTKTGKTAAVRWDLARRLMLEHG